MWNMPKPISIRDAKTLLQSSNELLSSGLTERQLRDAVRSGELHRVRRGWFVEGSRWKSLWPEGKHLVHVVAVARDARDSPPVFSHVSAAVVQGHPLYRYVPSRVEVRIPGPRHVTSAPDVLRHEGTLRDEDIIEVEGILTTSNELTTFDIARTLPLETAVALADAALPSVAVDGHVQDEVRAAAWREAVAARIVDGRGQRGIRQARWVVEFADGRAQLPGESVSRLQFHRLGVRNISLQVPVPAPHGGAYWLDFDLEDFDAFGEFDGEGKYKDAALRSGRTIEQVMLDEKYREDWVRGTTGRPVWRWGDKHAAKAGTLEAHLRSFGFILPR